ncbi:hypothetical protein J5X98_23560 [Leptothermofonsia sichuanensis E412]|uniref:hypothetical protein n=1 Tax=Leptothermofonsia sichuanensis TaxID=2917832 RepID=UPI001CA68D52|nr:hypothetical protein [Leptothermofonsia sichuanensis]QZZ20210.1 hypothetical protein J5X98_23560 [Leptothermofonsia sichuanensis E412]
MSSGEASACFETALGVMLLRVMLIAASSKGVIEKQYESKRSFEHIAFHIQNQQPPSKWS